MQWQLPRIPHISLDGIVHKAEDSIITLSGPALAISGIIAGIDLVTGGHVLQSQPVLTMVWAICLLLTLDFQVLALGARAHRVYLASHKSASRKAGEIILAVLVAASISYVSVQMQSIIARVNASGVSIDQAAAQLGINSLALIWERSALVLVLIFLSGWFRGEQSNADDASSSMSVPVAQPVMTPDLVAAIVDQVAAKQAQRFEAAIEQIVTRVTITAAQQTGELSAVSRPQLPVSIIPDGTQPETVGNDEDVKPVMLTYHQMEKLRAAWLALEAQGETPVTVSVNRLQEEAQVRREAAATWLKLRRDEWEKDSYHADEP